MFYLKFYGTSFLAVLTLFLIVYIVIPKTIKIINKIKRKNNK